MLSRVNWQTGHIDQAHFYLNEAAIRFERSGCRRGLAEVWNTRGELARAIGDLETAESAYMEAKERYESCGSDSAAYSKLNLGSTWVNAGKFRQAKNILDSLEAELLVANRPHVLLVTRLTRTICLIDAGEWKRVEQDLLDFGPELTRIGLVDTDVATNSRLAAMACEVANKPALAQLAWRITHNQLKALGKTEEANKVEARLGVSPTS